MLHIIRIPLQQGLEAGMVAEEITPLGSHSPVRKHFSPEKGSRMWTVEEEPRDRYEGQISDEIEPIKRVALGNHGSDERSDDTVHQS
jgi:hypothetical protein